MFSFEVIPGNAVKNLLDTSGPDILRVVGDAYQRHEDGLTVNPDSYFLRFPEKPSARIIALPSFAQLDPDAVAGIKWIASFPENIAHGIPRASAILVLNDYTTGYPIACLEAAGISAARTAASAAVTANAVARHVPPTGQIGLVGAGVIARTVLRYLSLAGYPIKDVRIHDLDEGSAGRFAEYAATEFGVTARATNLAEVLDCQTVVTATTAATPYIDQPLRPGQVVLNISLRDFAPEVALAAENIVDDVDHCLKANTTPHLAEQQVGHRDFVTATIPQVLRGTRTPHGRSGVLVSPFGLGVLDLAVGHFILIAARRAGTAMAIPDFFGDPVRP